MGLFDKLLKKKEEMISVATEHNTLYLPLEGEVIPLEEIGDGVFSAEILGKGCGIRPQEETVYAPANGTVTSIAETKHAVGIQTEDGIEVLIHVGMDTVAMNGDGFEVFVKQNQKVKCGQPLLRFSAAKIKACGYPTTTAFVVTNSDDYDAVAVIKTGNQPKLTAVLKVQ